MSKKSCPFCIVYYIFWNLDKTSWTCCTPTSRVDNARNPVAVPAVKMKTMSSGIIFCLIQFIYCYTYFFVWKKLKIYSWFSLGMDRYSVRPDIRYPAELNGRISGIQPSSIAGFPVKFISGPSLVSRRLPLVLILHWYLCHIMIYASPICLFTVFLRSLGPFYTGTYHMKWVKTPGT